jgi:predicted Fe-Mo cluster-binding NifX family protein
MKVCIPMEGTSVSQHFGHTPEFLIVTIEDGKIISREVYKSPGHEPGLLPKVMSEFGVTHVIAGGLGHKAREMFNERNITVISGVTGEIDDAVQALIDGKLVSGKNLCDH